MTQTCKVLSAFILAPVASYQINRKSSLPFSGAIMPALKHRIPSELRNYAFLGESSTRMGDLLGSPRVAPLLFALRFEPHFSIHSFFVVVPRLQHYARAPSLRVSRRNDALGGAHHWSVRACSA